MTCSEAAVTIAPYISIEMLMGKYTGGRNYPTRDEIARHAYRFYERRGRQNRYDLEDWLRAEHELKRHYE